MMKRQHAQTRRGGKRSSRLLKQAGGAALALLLAGCGSLPGGAASPAVNTPRPAEIAVTGPAAVKTGGPAAGASAGGPAGLVEALDSEEARRDMLGFASRSAGAVLKEADGKNMAYSPASLFIAASMLAEGARGETQQELLAALGAQTLGAARDRAAGLTGRLFVNNGTSTLQTANSIWMNQDFAFRGAFTDRISDSYRAESYLVNFKNPDAPKAVSDWVSAATGGLLGGDPEQFRQECTETTEYRPMMLLFNAIYFKDEWVREFDASKTEQAPFHAISGDEQADFMEMEYTGQFVKTGDFSAAGLGFKSGASMGFILPAEGKTPQDLLRNPELLASAVDFERHEESQRGEVRLRLPKFKISGTADLENALRALGVDKAWDPDKADLTGAIDDPEMKLYLSKVAQGTSVAVDEKGCEAAAYTEMAVAEGMSMPTGSLSLTLDRPFLFVLRSAQDDILFVGVIHHPANAG